MSTDEAAAWRRPDDGDGSSGAPEVGDLELEIEPIEDEPDDATDATPAPAAAPSPRRSRRRRRRIVVTSVVVVVALVGAGVAWWLGNRSDSSSAATTTQTTKQLLTVTSGTLDTTVSAEGKVAAAQTNDLNFASAGTVTAVNVKAGDTVKAGQVLATIDGVALAANTAKAQANLANAQAKLTDDQNADASDDQIAADQSSVTVAQDALNSAQFAAARLVDGVDDRRHGHGGEHHRRRAAVGQRLRGHQRDRFGQRLGPHRRRRRLRRSQQPDRVGARRPTRSRS